MRLVGYYHTARATVAWLGVGYGVGRLAVGSWLEESKKTHS